jgi:hypothetical protein
METSALGVGSAACVYRGVLALDSGGPAVRCLEERSKRFTWRSGEVRGYRVLPRSALSVSRAFPQQEPFLQRPVHAADRGLGGLLGEAGCSIPACTVTIDGRQRSRIASSRATGATAAASVTPSRSIRNPVTLSARAIL